MWIIVVFGIAFYLLLESNVPLPYTNIVLNNRKDSSFVMGTIAADDGGFISGEVPCGEVADTIK